MLHETKVKALVSQIVALANPKRVVLFGSLARNSRRVNDIDLLVVVPDSTNARQTSAKLQREVRRGGVAIDLVVVTESDVAKHEDDPSSVIFYALREGRNLHVA